MAELDISTAPRSSEERHGLVQIRRRCSDWA